MPKEKEITFAFNVHCSCFFFKILSGNFFSMGQNNNDVSVELHFHGLTSLHSFPLKYC